MKEIELQVVSYSELMKYLNIFSLTQNSCCLTLTKTDARVFGKFLTGRCDVFTGALTLPVSSVDGPESITVFVSDLKKFLYVLDLLKKYYPAVDNGTPFLTGEIRLFVAEDSSYIRISSVKYTIKHQLSSLASNSPTSSAYVTEPSKYATKAHEICSRNGNIIEDTEQLLAFKTDKKMLSNISSLLSALKDSEDARIKFELPEQVAIEGDLGGAGQAMNAIPSVFYAILSDNQKLMNTNLGSKVCVSAGNITYLDRDYKSHISTDSLVDNFIYLMSIDQLRLVTSVISAFAPTVAAEKPAKKKSKTPEPQLPAEKDEGSTEIGFSKINLLHLNLINITKECKSEMYVSMIGQKASNG